MWQSQGWNEINLVVWRTITLLHDSAGWLGGSSGLDWYSWSLKCASGLAGLEGSGQLLSVWLMAGWLSQGLSWDSLSLLHLSVMLQEAGLGVLGSQSFERSRSPNAQMLFKPLFASCLQMSHWLKQITWLISHSRKSLMGRTSKNLCPVLQSTRNTLEGALNIIRYVANLKEYC